MEAATPEGGRWARMRDGEWRIYSAYRATGSRWKLATAPTAPACALRAWGLEVPDVP